MYDSFRLNVGLFYKDVSGPMTADSNNTYQRKLLLAISIRPIYRAGCSLLGCFHLNVCGLHACV
jgi:hypothetical protein